MGAIITAAFAWLATAIVAVVAWAGAALTSIGLAQFLTFAAKIVFVYLLSTIIIAALQPFVQSLSVSQLGTFGNLGLWAASQVDMPYFLTTVLTAWVAGFGFRMIRHIF